MVKVILDKPAHNARFPNPGVPEKAHFELPYRHHVLRAGPGRGSASSGAGAAPAPSPRSPVSASPSRPPRAEPPPLLFLGRGRSRGRLPATPGASGLTSSAPRNAPRHRQPPWGGPGGVPPASGQLSSCTRLYRAPSGNCPSSPRAEMPDGAGLQDPRWSDLAPRLAASLMIPLLI